MFQLELLDCCEPLGRQGAAGPVGRHLFDAGDVLEEPAGDAVDCGGAVGAGAAGEGVDEAGVVGEAFRGRCVHVRSFPRVHRRRVRTI